ncbi:class A beta-lactamase [Chryseobacterium jejuense]|uniref:beta-lactamase n=1 Tax=Chryseobacterium jejuense TaxID=445960 RepID=A0A2X2VRR9_CHRJE|nr:class A beta-lactamase [Chryseobacterium jejuense]SDJ12139.1 beta-lactamase class A [Chryseobacterium jejuense]SQB27953.1 Extended-spectrum beta-lactamase PER-1 precursor [Chryseobacterium jejuense]
MKSKKIILTLFILFISLPLFSQNNTNPEFKKVIETIIAHKKADIGVSIVTAGTHKKEVTQINGNKPLPMLSTFKFPVALAVLHKVEKGELSLQQKIYIKKEELLEDTYSPFREKYPEGNMELSLEECIHWMMVYSDNNLTDILIRLIGGPDYVQNFINSKDIVIKNDEEGMHKDWDSQFINTITPNAAIRLLEQFYNGKILNKEHTKWLYTVMINNATGTKRLKGKLPKDVKVAHRTGTSFTNKAGMTGAINNYGIIELSDKKRIYIAVFIHDTFETFENSEAIIADIAKAAYNYYNK